jgi:hypothetical protein
MEKKMSMRIYGIAAIIVCTFAAANLQGDEIGELKQLLMEQRKQIEALTSRLSELEEKQNQLEGKTYALDIRADEQEDKTTALDTRIDEKVKFASASGGEIPVPESVKWAQLFDVDGDFRFRNDYVDDEGKSDEDFKNSIRARLNVTANVNDEMKVKSRIAAGTEDPVSTNNTLGDDFASDGVWIDRLYVDYKPAWADDFGLWAGKFGTPFYVPGGTQVMWDSDLNPEGGALKYETKLSDTATLFAGAGGYWVQKNKTDTDVGMFGGQLGLRTDLDEKSKLTFGAGYYDYGNIKGQDLNAVSLKESYNSLDGSGNFVYDYNIAEGFANYDFQIFERPASVYGTYLVNTASGVEEDTAWAAGVKTGKVTSDLGSWELGYEYRDTESDAVVAAFTESDFAGGRTDSRGHKISLKYGISKNFSSVLSLFHNEYGSNDTDYNRIQLDFIAKFK